MSPTAIEVSVRAVVDSSAILGGFEPVPPEDFAVPPSVVSEVSKGTAGRRMRQLVDAGLVVKQPSDESMKAVRLEAESLGEQDRLSLVDVDVLALALDLGVPCLTDDYSVQNVAVGLDIETQSFREAGIKEVWAWGLRCTGCRRTFEAGEASRGDQCPVCGSPLRSFRRM